ncbi:RNA-dependent RNA polymerase [Wenzhou narna-like virus 2]|uniref:RNA-dependent RNA polymerase n=1 Tax=Wenzhou narna-like virus 2 TaxID=1923577 RepID=UPI00090C621E|nr:RNA-dependent RNA polymerase [Wenzhou narna-like virus 2]APG77161.1 RNA-dependent RNA polymerase [Wenzhou narna-like virus 2]
MLSTLRRSCAGTDPAFPPHQNDLIGRDPSGPCEDGGEIVNGLEPADPARSRIEAYLHGLRQAARVESVWEYMYSLYQMKWSPLTAEDRGLWAWLAMNDQLETYIKYKSALNLSQTWRQEELPEPPAFLAEVPACYKPPAYGLVWSTSDLWRNINRRDSHPSEKITELAYALYQAKAGALPMRPELVDSKVDGVVKQLTTPVKTRTIEVMGQRLGLREMFDAVSRTVAEIYGPVQEERLTPGALRLASVKSSFQSSRGDGGAHEFICRDAGWDVTLGFPQLVGYTGGVSPVPLYGTSSEDWVDTVEVSRRSAWSETMACYPVGLVEPFKVRVITRGAAHSYHLARRWQKSLWRPLAEHPTFQLVGRPMSHSIMMDMVEKMTLDDRVWMSGDYQAATDNFDPQLSNHCLAEVCARIGVPYEDQLILRKALTGHAFFDPDTNEFLGHQARGQLMGSPVSFPILCLLNASLTRLAFEIAGREALPLSDQIMLINGDDLLCRVNSREYKAWKIVTRAGGLTPSLGKCFRHKNMATINSEMWRISRRAERLPFNGVVRYFTAHRYQLPLEGLAYGSMKGASGTTDKQRRIEGLSIFHPQNVRSLSSMGKCWEEYAARRPHYLQSRPHFEAEILRSSIRLKAYDHLWSVNTDRLRIDLPDIAYCLPLRLGGLGLPLPPGDSPHYRARQPRPQQLGLAHLLASRPYAWSRLSETLRETRPTYAERMVTSGRRYVRDLPHDEAYESIIRQGEALGFPLAIDLRRGVKGERTVSAPWALSGSVPIPGGDGDSFKLEWSRLYRRAGRFRNGKPVWEPIHDRARLARMIHRDFVVSDYDIPTPTLGVSYENAGNGHEEDVAYDGVWWSTW